MGIEKRLRDMRKKTKIPALGSDFCQIFKRKAGSHEHRLNKRNKTRQKAKRIEKVLSEY
jgi:hypothetical protein|tara:strand:- start:465 stop:641 length:177 start_codon:yes stop_codon:yes gene_type:complete